MKLSILIITYKRAFQLERCLNSVFSQLPDNSEEVLVWVNGDDLLTTKMLAEKKNTFSALKYFQGKQLSRGAARNALIKQSTGEIICFLDDDVVLAEQSIEAFLNAADQNPQIAILGGANLGFPGSDHFQVAQSQVLGSFLGTAWMSRRYQESRDVFNADERCLTLCNLVIRRKALSQNETIFHENFVSCEENLLLRQMLAQGLKAVFLGKFIVFHERRHTYHGLCRQIFQYGQGRMQTIRAAPASYDFIFWVPPIFFLYLVLLPILATIPKHLLPLVSYFFLTGLMSAIIAYKHKILELFPLSIVIFLLIHICYGAGFLFELFFPRK